MIFVGYKVGKGGEEQNSHSDPLQCVLSYHRKEHQRTVTSKNFRMNIKFIETYRIRNTDFQERKRRVDSIR